MRLMNQEVFIMNKEYWYITDKGDLAVDIAENKYKDRFRKKIGNYFKSVYDADKYLTKLESKNTN